MYINNNIAKNIQLSVYFKPGDKNYFSNYPTANIEDLEFEETIDFSYGAEIKCNSNGFEIEYCNFQFEQLHAPDICYIDLYDFTVDCQTDRLFESVSIDLIKKIITIE